MLQYLSSQEFKAHKPKVIIWEFPIYQNFRDKNFYKQLIPSLYGDCEGKAVFEQSVNILDNKIEINVPVNLLSSYSYIYLDAPNFDKKKLRLVVTYEDGTRAPFDFKRSKYYEPDGKFFLMLEEKKKPLKIEALFPHGDYEKAQLKICPYSL